MEEDELASGLGEGTVASGTRPSGVRLPEDLDVATPALQLNQIAPGVIGRPIIDNQNLDQVSG